MISSFNPSEAPSNASEPFWSAAHLASLTHPVLIDAHTGESFTGPELQQMVDRVSAELAGYPRAFVFLQAAMCCQTVAVYLACLQQFHVVYLLPADLPEQALADAMACYQPNVLISLTHDRVLCYRHLSTQAHALNASLALLLSTSASTGQGKLVRISTANLQANADSIIDALPIQPTDRTLLNLPLHYSFGLSVINTFLQVGACCVLTSASVMSTVFWDDFQQYAPQCFYGVPFSFDMLARLGFARLEHANFRYLAHAGGALSVRTQSAIKTWCTAQQLPMYSMYGQTEATARMAVLAPERFGCIEGEIGEPIAGGVFTLATHDQLNDVQNTEQNVSELVYSGENVMLGYAQSLEDLARGDDYMGMLHTGDLVRKTANGWMIVGRSKRFIKLSGHRLSLDVLERFTNQTLSALSVSTECVCVGNDQQLCIVHEQAIPSAAQTQLTRALNDRYAIHPRVCRFLQVDAIPRTSNQKIHYAALTSLIHIQQGGE